MKFALIVVLATLASPSEADEYWEFGSWWVSVKDVDTGQDIRRTCSAHTGGDGDPALSIIISDGDVGPPIGFPTVLATERAPRGYKTLLQGGEDIAMVFDSGDVVMGSTYAFRDPEGFAVAETVFDQPSAQAALRALRANARFEIRVAGRLFLQGDLNGFSASYLKVVDECGFTGEGVLD